MTLKRCLTVALLTSGFFLTSCSGVKTVCTVNCPVSGTATLLITLTATPLTPPGTTNLLSFSVTVVGVSLTPSSGGAAVNVSLNNATYTVDLTRLHSDSAFVATSATIPAGTYSNMVVSLSSPQATYCTQTTGATGCAAGSVKTVSGGAAAPQITTTPFPLSLTANQTQGLAVNFNLANALTVTPQTQVVTAVNLAAASVLSASKLPPTASSLLAGELSFIEDITGVVTASNASTQSVTVKTATRGSITATANSFTVFSPNCTNFKLALNFSSCVVQGQVASLDIVLNTNGTFTLLEYDPLATATGDWIEGMVTSTPSSSTQFQLVTNEVVLSTTNSLIGSGLTFAAPVNVTLAAPKPFAVDSKGLVVPSAIAFNGGTDTSMLAPGQTVAARVTAFTAGSGSTLAVASADFLYLRFTRVTGSVSSTAPPNAFVMQSFPPFFALTTPITVQLSTGSPSTKFEGISGASAVTASQTVSITALYFGPPFGITTTPTPFSAAKVRVP